jgi:hypothetical protein
MFYDLTTSKHHILTIFFEMFLYRINEDENLVAVSPRRCQGRGCSRGLNLDSKEGLVYFCMYF